MADPQPGLTTFTAAKTLDPMAEEVYRLEIS